MEFLLKQLIAACRELREPAGYYHGITGGRQDMPDNIILLHRCREMKISFAHNADKLYHSRYVLTLNLKAEGLVCVNEKSFPLPEGYAFTVKAIQYDMNTQSIKVIIKADKQYWGDVTPYQAQIESLNAAVAQKDTQLTESEENLAAANAQLAELEATYDAN